MNKMTKRKQLLDKYKYLLAILPILLLGVIFITNLPGTTYSDYTKNRDNEVNLKPKISSQGSNQLATNINTSCFPGASPYSSPVYTLEANKYEIYHQARCQIYLAGDS